LPWKHTIKGTKIIGPLCQFGKWDCLEIMSGVLRKKGQLFIAQTLNPAQTIIFIITLEKDSPVGIVRKAQQDRSGLRFRIGERINKKQQDADDQHAP